MTCILLVAGHGTLLEEELSVAVYDRYVSGEANASEGLRRYFEHPAVGVPKALLPSSMPSRGGDANSAMSIVEATNQTRGYRTILDGWYDQVRSQPGIRDIVLVSNADKFKHFERWATSRGFPLDNLLNTGSTASSNNSRGSLSDVDLALRTLEIRNAAAASAASAHEENVAAAEDSMTGDVPNKHFYRKFGSGEFAHLAQPVIVIAADTAITRSFDLNSIMSYFASKNASGSPPCDLVTYYASACLPRHNVGVLTVDHTSKTVTSFIEGVPDAAAANATAHPVLVAAPLYFLTVQTASRLHHFCEHTSKLEAAIADVAQSTVGIRSPPTIGSFVAHIVHQPVSKIVALRLPSAVQLIGSRTTTLLDYERFLRDGGSASGAAHNDSIRYRAGGASNVPRPVSTQPHHGQQPIRSVCRRSWARVGLMGNPSDQLNGKSVALTVRNFGAEVTCFESEQVRLMAHPLYDPCVFGNLRDLLVVSKNEGYMGGLRLIQATCKRFVESCASLGVVLPNRNFTIKYETNVPRQVGLAGSSCIVSACLKALIDFFELTSDDIPKQIVPSIVLSVETQELGIHAGLMDRVAQMYEGLVAMDFNKEFLDANGFGIYETVDPEIAQRVMPTLHLAYAMDPSDSGKIHSNVKERWAKGDPEVHEAARSWAGFVDEMMASFRIAAHAVTTAPGSVEATTAIANFQTTFAELMDKNFNLRRKLYGDACLGWKNLRMIEIAREHGAAAKFPGSGGAILVCCRTGKTDPLALRYAYEAENFVFIKLDPYLPRH